MGAGNANSFPTGGPLNHSTRHVTDPELVEKSLGFLLEDGKLAIVAQSADFLIDRKVTAEVRATVLK